ncbi:MAG TPA: metallophosphoesterase [Haliangiales bacterium]|nr:metallophosphoesterase [Haliangiales bacterium]
MASILRLPAHGRLLVATDLQGHLRDFDRMADLFGAAMVETDGDAHLLFTGDLIHGPSYELEEWPEVLGDYYRDDSPAVVDGFLALGRRFPGRVHSLLGNHEHAHVGGPHTAKFAPDEVTALEDRLGEVGALRLREILLELPLVAVAPCGLAFTHAAPAAPVASVDDILAAPLAGHEKAALAEVFDIPVVGPLLWARWAPAEVARRFLAAVDARVAVYGHDVVREGFERIGEEQIVFSTSFGLLDARKVYLDLDLARPVASAYDIRENVEILPLYPDLCESAVSAI